MTMTPDEYCQERAASSGSSFYYSFLFLPAEQRRAITALYAFCREVDDVVDECRDASVAQNKLIWWREELERTYHGEPQHPVGQALQPIIEQFAMPQEELLEIIDGMEMDLVQQRYASFNELRLYCHRVAGVVGLLAAEIFGYEDRHTRKYADALGLALQLTNILRDLREDAERGRIYIPEDELQKFGVTAEDLRRPQASERVEKLLQFQAERALQCYHDAYALLPPDDRYRQRTGLVMAAIYEALLHEIIDGGYKVLEGRTSISPLRKLWIAWKTMQHEKRQHKRLMRRQHA